MIAGRGTSGSGAAGGLVRHRPVMLREVLSHLSPRDGGVYVDGTFGAGGHTTAMLEAADCRVIAIDRDRGAVAHSADLVEAMHGRLTVVEDRFSRLDFIAEDLGFEHVDGVLLDLGVSSMQLDEADRGFSFRADGPLDMRMGGNGTSAADIVNEWSEDELAEVFHLLGEERRSRAVARAIAKARTEKPIARTAELADIVRSVVHARPDQIDPATRTFQALRILVNDELNQLGKSLVAAERILRPGGRLAVISFHSIEDRIVKTFLNARSKQPSGSRHQPEIAPIAPTFRVLTRRPETPARDELDENPRSRSAKLRAAERTEAPTKNGNGLAEYLARLPSLECTARRD